jgi:hypothetical protein
MLDKAFELLELAVERRLPVILSLRADPRFDTLRKDPRFPSLLKRTERASSSYSQEDRPVHVLHGWFRSMLRQRGS